VDQRVLVAHVVGHGAFVVVRVHVHFVDASAEPVDRGAQFVAIHLALLCSEPVFYF